MEVATPSPKLRVENAVSPSGIIHAALQGHHAGSHQIACREKGILQVVDHRLVRCRDRRKVVVLYVDDNIKEKKDVETHEVWGMMRFRKSKQILDI